VYLISCGGLNEFVSEFVTFYSRIRHKKTSTDELERENLRQCQDVEVEDAVEVEDPLEEAEADVEDSVEDAEADVEDAEEGEAEGRAETECFEAALILPT
jgi:hypothetical protein